tara:strand:- start:159 stop:362 length:204 start_codon:yes stop_codon:yes gene_type:complete
MSEMTAKQYSENFQTELKELLQRYKVDISLEDVGRDYMPDIIIVAEFDYNSDLGVIDDIKYGCGISQ